MLIFILPHAIKRYSDEKQDRQNRHHPLFRSLCPSLRSALASQSSFRILCFSLRSNHMLSLCFVLRSVSAQIPGLPSVQLSGQSPFTSLPKFFRDQTLVIFVDRQRCRTRHGCQTIHGYRTVRCRTHYRCRILHGCRTRTSRK